jgi:hypothetical protein
VLGADFDVKNALILAAVPGLETVFALRNYLLDVGGGAIDCFVGLQVGNAHAQKFRFAVAAHPTIGLFDLQQTPLRIYQPEAVHGRLEDAPVPFFALPQCLLRPLAQFDGLIGSVILIIHCMTPSFYQRSGQRVLGVLKNAAWLEKYHRFSSSVMCRIIFKNATNSKSSQILSALQIN